MINVRRSASGDIFSPKIANDEPLKLEVSHFLELVRHGGTGVEARDGLVVVQALEALQHSLDSAKG